jgi:hypothetical protein
MTLRVVPWMTDDSVRFIDCFIDRIKAREGRSARILEFGMGASTLYFSQKGAHVTSFEHDKSWYEKIVAILAASGFRHISAFLEERPYHNKIEKRVVNAKFDVISIDGRDRVLCLKEVLRLNSVLDNGIIVIDNTERISGDGARYHEMLMLLEGTFSAIHFEQIGPDRAMWQAPHRWITTVAWKNTIGQFTTRGVPL